MTTYAGASYAGSAYAGVGSLLHVRTVEDGTSATDAATRATLQLRSAGDASGVLDSVSSSSLLLRISGDSAPAGDSISSSATSLRTVGDTAPVADDGTRLPLVLARGGADSIIGTSEDAVRSGTFGRSLGDAAGGTDALTETAFLYRNGSDGGAVIDSVNSPATAFRVVEDSIPGPTSSSSSTAIHIRAPFDGSTFISETLSSSSSLFRVITDGTVLFEEVFSVRQYPRDATDGIGGVGDSLATELFLFRGGNDLVEPTDGVTRSGVFGRVVEDLSEAFEAVLQHIATHPRVVGDQAVVEGDEARRFAARFRSGEEEVGVADSANQNTSQFRTSTDLVPLVEEFLQQISTHPRSGVEAVSPVGDVSIRTILLLRGSGELVAAVEDAATRWQDLHRQIEDLAPAADYRLVPKASIDSISRGKVSDKAGYDTVEVTFSFDLPVTAWSVRVDSETHRDGTPVGIWSGPSPTQYGSVTIPASVLRRGSNRLTVYGRSLDGVWTR